MDWMKIGAAVLLVAMLVYLVPRAKAMIDGSPKASGQEWMGALVPLLLVLGFILLLVKVV